MVLQHTSYRTYLSEELARRLRDNPRYSLRSFARHLGLSPGELSEILRGRRELGARSLFKVSQALGLNPTETRHLSVLVQAEKAKRLGRPSVLKTDQEFSQELGESEKLSLEAFSMVADWYHFAILNLMEVSGFKWDERWIAKHLNLSRTEALLAMRRLERLELVKKDKKGKVSRTEKIISAAGDGIPSEAVRRYHQQILRLALNSLDTQSLSQRENAGVCFATTVENLASIKRDMSDFLDAILAKYSRGRKKDGLMHVEIACFQVAKV